MKIWVDADACPRPIKEILYRVADRTAYINLIQVGQGADVADDEIANKCKAGDLIITADIPLAARVVEKGALALDPRGKVYDKNNIGQILDMRNFMDNLRGSGVETGGPAGFGQKERFKFANELDRFLGQR